jgi:uncharacterized protein YndB with AHSA1/START domain
MPDTERTPSTHYGEVRRREDGQTIVYYERPLRHSIGRVWAAVTAPEQRAVWAPGLRFEPQPDARFDIWFGDECEGPAHVSGTLSAFEPPTAVEIGSIRIELVDQAPGCLLIFSDVLWFDGKRTRVDFANAVLAGWHRFLDTLEIWLDEGVAALDLVEPDYAAVDVPGRDDL